MKVFRLALPLVLICFHVAHAQRPFTQGMRAFVEYPFSGCRNVDTMNHIVELSLENDERAAAKLAIRSGADCRIFEKGQPVITEAFRARHSLICIRVSGDPDCYWYPANYLHH